MNATEIQSASVPAPDEPKPLQLKDNNQFHFDETQLSSAAIDLLRHFSGQSLATLRNGPEGLSEGIVIFGRISDIDDSKSVFELLEDAPGPLGENGIPIRQYIIQTHNIMGVFTLHHGQDALQLQITSRFDKSEKQPFLCWMLERVLRVTFSDFIGAKKDCPFWTILLELLFWRKLGEASCIGLYRQYQRMEYNDLRFRGRLDIDRHIRLNMPLWDKIAYSRREIAYDNPINHLLRHAAKKVLSHWSDVITEDRESKNSLDMVSAIEINTPSWSQGNLRDVLLDKDVLQGISHPYYAEYYEELRMLALYIVLEQGVDLYSQEQSSDFSINGILFDGAWLWEEYLSTLLATDGFIHAIPMDTYPIYALKRENRKYRTLFPDFRLPASGHDNQASIILDAKYKRGDSNNGREVRREDMHQCFCYMLLTGAAAGGVIYPPFLEQEKIADDCDDENTLEVFCPGEKRFWRCFTFGSVDQCVDETFAKTMIENENRLRQYIKQMKLLCKIP